MKRLLIAAVFALGALCHAQTKDSVKAIILPNPALLGCAGKNCTRLWLDDGTRGKAVYPRQLLLDVNSKSPYGIMAIYEKPISIGDVRTAIQQRYGKWAAQVDGKPLPDIWRVETEKFIVSISPADDDYGRHHGGSPQDSVRVIYLAFQPLNTVLCNLSHALVGADASECQKQKHEDAPNPK